MDRRRTRLKPGDWFSRAPVGYLFLMLEGYLVDLGSREHEAVERLISLPVIGEDFFSSLGLASGFSWYLLRMRADRLVASVVGDVDLLGGRLEWTPSLDHLVAVEAKCAYLPANALEISEGALRSTKQSRAKIRHVRRQV